MHASSNLIRTDFSSSAQTVRKGEHMQDSLNWTQENISKAAFSSITHKYSLEDVRKRKKSIDANGFEQQFSQTVS